MSTCRARPRLPAELGDQPAQALRERHAAGVDADERGRARGRGCLSTISWAMRASVRRGASASRAPCPASTCAATSNSFPASRDRVKGVRPEVSGAGGRRRVQVPRPRRSTHSVVVSTISGQLRFGAREAGGVLGLVEQVQRRDVRPRIRSSASSRVSGRLLVEPVSMRTLCEAGLLELARELVHVREAGAVDRRRMAGKSSLSQYRSKCSGANVATTTPSARVRARVRPRRNARARSTRWSTSRKTTRSNQPSLNGSASAAAQLEPRRAAPARARASISGDGSTPQTLRAALARARPRSCPVPQPTSSTRRPARSPSATSTLEELAPVARRPAEAGRTTRRAAPKSASALA